MKTYKFTSDMIVEAESEAKAREYFADNSLDFAGNAGIEEVCAKHFEPLLEVYAFEKCKRCK